MPGTTIKDLQTDYARIGAKVQKQEQALSPDAIATASVSDLAAANGEILADVQALREKLKAAMIPLSDGREIFKHEYEALQQLARENWTENSKVLDRLTGAKIVGGQVTAIDLSNLGLSNVTPLEALSGLVQLNLAKNALEEDPHFPPLPKLQNLSLHHNKITGLSGIAHLKELTELNLWRTALKGDPLFSAWPKLQTLNLSGTRITGVSGLAPLADLAELQLWDTAIKDQPQFPVLPKLRKLNLGDNQITGVAGLAPLTELSHLEVSNTTLQGDPQFPALPKLKVLELQNNKITGVSGLSHLRELVSLYLCNNAITGNPQFPILPKLQRLDLRANSRITGVSGLHALTGLKTLAVDAYTNDRLGPQLKTLKQRGVTVEVS